MEPLLLYVLPLFFSATLGFILALFILRNRHAMGAQALLILVLGDAVWSLGYAMELLAPTLAAKLFWARFQYFGIIAVPLAWYIFSVQHLGSRSWTEYPLRYRTFLWTIPILTLCLVWTNDAHGLIWQDVSLHMVGGILYLTVEHGLWFWVNSVYSYTLIIIGTITLVRGLLGSVRYHRWQIILLLLASFFPLVANLIYISELNPLPHLDWTPFAFVIAGLLFTISLFRFQLFSIIPVAHKTIFTGLSESVLVLDIEDCIIDFNPSAQAVILNSDKNEIGKPVTELLPDLLPWLEQAGFEQEFCMEIARGTGAEQRFFDLHISPLKGPGSQPIGRLVSYHDITQLKQEQARLEHARHQLEQVVHERTETLRLTIEQLQHELSQRSLAEKRFAKVVELAPDAMLLFDSDVRIMLVNKQAEELFGYPREELVGQNIRKLIPLQRREQDHRVLKQYVDNPTTRRISFGMDLVGLRRDGSEFPIEISLGPLQTETGYMVVCNLRDISERIKADQAQKRLLEEIQQSQAQLRALTTRLQTVQELERRQIARELHDRVGQNLTGLNLNLQLIGNQLPVDVQDQIRGRLDDSLKLVEETTRQVRDVMADLHPLVLEEYGLVSALKWYGDNFAQRTGITTRVVSEEFDHRLPANVEMVLFRLVQEALNNVAKHAHATRVVISTDFNPDVVRLQVEDNGRGFDPQAVSVSDGQPHWGLVHMQQRATSIGGELVVDSAPGQGTQVMIRVWRDRDEH